MSRTMLTRTGGPLASCPRPPRPPQQQVGCKISETTERGVQVVGAKMEEAAPTLGRWRDEVVIASERGFAAAKDVSFIFIFRETASIPPPPPPSTPRPARRVQVIRLEMWGFYGTGSCWSTRRNDKGRPNPPPDRVISTKKNRSIGSRGRCESHRVPPQVRADFFGRTRDRLDRYPPLPSPCKKRPRRRQGGANQVLSAVPRRWRARRQPSCPFWFGSGRSDKRLEPPRPAPPPHPLLCAR